MRKLFCVLWMLLFCFAFCGCAKEQEVIMPAEHAEGSWREKGFATPQKEASEELYWVGDILSWQDGETTEDGLTHWTVANASLGSSLYQLFTVYANIGDQWIWDHYLLECWNPATGEKWDRKLTLEDLGGEESKRGQLRGFTVTGPETFAFWWEAFLQRGDGSHVPAEEKLLFVDAKGMTGSTDLTEVLTEKGILEKTVRCLADGNGHVYVMAGGMPRNAAIYAFDQDGKSLAQWNGGEETTFRETLTNESSEVLFIVGNFAEKADQFLCLDEEKHEFHGLGKLENGLSSRSFLGMLGDSVYYLSAKSIYEWNVVQGTNLRRLDLQKNGLPTNYGVTPFISEKDQLPRLWFQAGEGDSYVAVLSLEEKERDEIKFVDLVNDYDVNQILSECSSDYSKKHLGLPVTFQTDRSQEEKDRFYAEFLSGKGADLMYVSREDFVMLSEKGGLMELSDLISKETMDKILPGAIGLGTANGNFMGIPGGMTASGLWVPDEVWEGSSWTLEDVINLMEAGKLDVSLYYPEMNKCYASFALLRLLSEDWQHSFLYDKEKNDCHFDDERFVRLVKMAADAPKPENEDTWFGEGRRMAHLSLSYLPSFCEFGMEAAREKGHIVGLPTDGENGCFLNTGGLLVVSKDCKHLKEVSEFLELFLSEETQKSRISGLGVLKYPLDKIVSDEEGHYWFKAPGMRDRKELYVFEDGTTSAHRAEAFLESCVALPITDSVIDRIIYEELDAMFAGDKTPEETCKIIQNRVWLYIKETE